jgi:hypothetical protein
VTVLSNRALARAQKAEGRPLTIPELERRLARLPDPRLTPEEAASVGVAVAGGSIVGGMSLAAHQAFARHVLERRLWRARAEVRR